MRIAARIALLTGLWLLAWGEISAANLVSGILVSAALLAAFPPASDPSARVRIRPLGLARLAGYIAVQLVTSNVVMTREILRRRSTMQPGVVAHRLQSPSEHVVTVMTGVIALSPGTMTVDVDPESTTIHVHFLFLRDENDARALLARLEALVVSAVSTRSPSATNSGVT